MLTLFVPNRGSTSIAIICVVEATDAYTAKGTRTMAAMAHSIHNMPTGHCQVIRSSDLIFSMLFFPRIAMLFPPTAMLTVIRPLCSLVDPISCIRPSGKWKYGNDTQSFSGKYINLLFDMMGDVVGGYVVDIISEYHIHKSSRYFKSPGKGDRHTILDLTLLHFLLYFFSA